MECRGAGLLALSLLAAGCGDAAPTKSAPAPSLVAADPAHSASAHPEPTAPAREKPPAPAPGTHARVASVEGVATCDGAPASAGRVLDPGAALTVEAAGRVALDVAQSGRIQLEDATRAWIGGDVAAQVLLLRGVAIVQVPPAGDGKLIAQRVATPRGSFLFRPGTTSLVAVHDRGDVLVHVIDGKAEVVTDTLDETQATESAREVTIASAKRFSFDRIEDLKPAEDVTSALLKARAFMAGKAAGRRADASTAPQAALEGAWEALEGERARGEEIAAQHKQAVVSHDAAARATRQRELVAHGQRLVHLRRALLVAWEQAQLRAFAIETEPSSASESGRAFLSTWRAKLQGELPR